MQILWPKMNYRTSLSVSISSFDHRGICTDGSNRYRRSTVTAIYRVRLYNAAPSIYPQPLRARGWLLWSPTRRPRTGLHCPGRIGVSLSCSHVISLAVIRLTALSQSLQFDHQDGGYPLRRSASRLPVPARLHRPQIPSPSLGSSGRYRNSVSGLPRGPVLASLSSQRRCRGPRSKRYLLLPGDVNFLWMDIAALPDSSDADSERSRGIRSKQAR
ncbi:hypothetical protein LXA43DRAFT_644716 [Ganoderma leucocontextum]|nr:hypothetical protein LXA43DRAFT_644716 [Ganoderma leucocontextum]